MLAGIRIREDNDHLQRPLKNVPGQLCCYLTAPLGLPFMRGLTKARVLVLLGRRLPLLDFLGCNVGCGNITWLYHASLS